MSVIESQDFYRRLGVDRSASQKKIRWAYRKLAFKCHPDINKEEDATERISRINEAYEILGDKEKRRAYDSEHPIKEEQKYYHKHPAKEEPKFGLEYPSNDLEDSVTRKARGLWPKQPEKTYYRLYNSSLGPGGGPVPVFPQSQVPKDSVSPQPILKTVDIVDISKIQPRYEIYVQKLKEGFTKVAKGISRGERKLYLRKRPLSVDSWLKVLLDPKEIEVFYGHPTGKGLVYQFSNSSEAEYTPENFQKVITEGEIILRNQQSLENVIDILKVYTLRDGKVE